MEKSRLVLGTTQLGMRYGLSNTSGQPSKEDSFKILDAALAGGINTFDTAYAYGNAEEILGEWMRERNVSEKVFIISKMKPHVLNDYPDGTKAEDVVRREIETSLARLRLGKLDGYLFHTPSYVYLSHALEGLRKAKAAGLVSHVGVSVYDEAEGLQAAELALDYVQIPENALDKRMDMTDFWHIAKKNKVTVFARSPFLQGLLVMDPRTIPPRLAYTRPHVEKFQAIVKKNGLAPAQAALSFSYVRSKAKHIVFGVETLAQLQANVEAVARAAEAPWMREVEEDFRDIERAVVNPSIWSRIKQ